MKVNVESSPPPTTSVLSYRDFVFQTLLSFLLGYLRLVVLFIAPLSIYVAANTTQENVLKTSRQGAKNKTKDFLVLHDGCDCGTCAAPIYLDGWNEKHNYADVGAMLEEDNQLIFVEDIPAVKIDDSHLRSPRIILPEDVNATSTPLKSGMLETSFSAYLDERKTPGGNRDPFVTPTISPLATIKSVSLSVLKAASERINDILRENRRRLDAGEDPSTARKEARRKRFEELHDIRESCAKLLAW